MAGIDFTMLQTHAGGQIAGRPMSNNGDVDYDGDSWFFTMEDTDMVREISAEQVQVLTGSALHYVSNWRRYARQLVSVG
jgi:general stress protein 26